MDEENNHNATHEVVKVNDPQVADKGPLLLWTLRILVRLKYFERFAERYSGFYNEELLQGIGLGEYYKADVESKEQRDKVFEKMRQHLFNLESSIGGQKDDVYGRNIEPLQSALNLSEADIEVLRFAVILGAAGTFCMLMDMLGELSNDQAKLTLSTILGVPLKGVHESLHSESALVSSGLLRVEALGATPHMLRGWLQVPQGVQYALSQEHADTSAVMQCFFREAVQPRLQMDDFPHIHNDAALLQNYLTSAVNKNTRGVNILIYGEPGTGKTELVRALVEACDLALFEIPMQALNGEAIAGQDRFSAFMLSQKLLAHKKRSAIMFDEIEDVFPLEEYAFFGPVRTSNSKKAWVNHTLEENPVPAFWICNSARHIDPSYLRRFDFTLKLGAPTRIVRRRMLEKYLSVLPVSDAWLTRMAEHEHLVPAHIERAAKVATHLEINDTAEVEQTLERIIGNTLEVMGLPRKPRLPATEPTRYRLEFLNADCDLVALTEGLKHRGAARLCLYGAPGSGKTAFAHYLARQLDKSVLMRRASDILSKWVGEAEQNIAAMFHEAEAENMVLVLDEADSFLNERAGAYHSWEVSQVNELLVQMEAFEGVFIASTNLMDNLDAASLRRFDFKIKFDYLKPQQAWAMFCQVLQEHGQSASAALETYKSRVAHLHNLTPGDFANVIRQANTLAQSLSEESLLLGLEKECFAKPGQGKPIGFVHT